MLGSLAKTGDYAKNRVVGVMAITNTPHQNSSTVQERQIMPTGVLPNDLESTRKCLI